MISCRWSLSTFLLLSVSAVGGFNAWRPAFLPSTRCLVREVEKSFQLFDVGDSSFTILDFDEDDDDESDDGESFVMPKDDRPMPGFEYDDEEEEEDIPKDPYKEAAPEEFMEDEEVPGSLLMGPVTTQDWGAEYGKLRERVEQQKKGEAGKPSTVLFRLMTAETPNQAIASFLRSAKPQVVEAMSGAVSSLLGGLSNPAMGIETVVKASGEKVASLCFQLQMTGYMFRNAEYVMALKDVMKLKGEATVQEYKDAFERLDTDSSGYIDADEVEDLLGVVYGEAVPPYEVKSFMKFFDSNKDGKISWEEFEKGLGAMSTERAAKKVGRALGLLPPSEEEVVDDDDDDEMVETITGTIQIENKVGKVIEVDAKEYVDGLRKEARELKEALRKENLPMGVSPDDGGGMIPGQARAQDDGMGGGIAEYIASRGGDVKSLTEGISPEIVETMKRLVDFVLEGGNSSKKIQAKDKSKIEMEIPGNALQQLALWQLVLGYKLREEEAKGDYLRILE